MRNIIDTIYDGNLYPLEEITDTKQIKEVSGYISRHKEKLFDKLEGVTKKARALAEKIREKRKKAAIVLRKSVTESLVFLDMPRRTTASKVQA